MSSAQLVSMAQLVSSPSVSCARISKKKKFTLLGPAVFEGLLKFGAYVPDFRPTIFQEEWRTHPLASSFPLIYTKGFAKKSTTKKAEDDLRMIKKILHMWSQKYVLSGVNALKENWRSRKTRISRREAEPVKEGQILRWQPWQQTNVESTLDSTREEGAEGSMVVQCVYWQSLGTFTQDGTVTLQTRDNP